MKITIIFENGKRNYDRRIDGPRLFGSYDDTEARYTVVEKLDKAILHKIIKKD